MTGPGGQLQGAGCSSGGQPCDPNPGVSLQITAQQIAAQGQPQKVTYATQPALKTQFLTTPISQAQKLAGTQQVQTQIQVSRGHRHPGPGHTASLAWIPFPCAPPPT